MTTASSASPAFTEVDVRITSLATPEDAAAFRALNEEWIARMFTLTEADRITLGDPRGHIVARGGDVLLARMGRDDGDAPSEALGCVALLPYGDGVFELAKMSVSPQAQGLGIGRKLLDAALARAAELGGRRVFLGTNSRLAPAIHLYEKVGFRRISRAELPVADYYARADVLMDKSVG